MNISSSVILMVLSTGVFSAEGGVDLKTEIVKDDRVVLAMSKWNPSDNEINDALSAIGKYLNDSSIQTTKYVSEGKRNIIDDIKNFRVQFVCRFENEQKIVNCSFFHKSSNDSDWKIFPIAVDGGGWRYWQINYNVSSGTVNGFVINGPE